MVRVPVNVPPVRARLPDAVPVKFDVILLAAKLPEESRRTAVLFELVLYTAPLNPVVNVILPACQIMLLLTVALLQAIFNKPVPVVEDPLVDEILTS